MSCAKQECVDYVEFVRKIEEHEIDGWSYGIDNRRADLHDRLCDAYGVDHEKTKKFTLWLNKYLDRAHGDWNRVPELLHDDLVRLSNGEDVKPPERKSVRLTKNDVQRINKQLEKPVSKTKEESKPKEEKVVVGGGSKPKRYKIPLSIDLPALLKELNECGDVGCASYPLVLAASLLNKVAEVAMKIDNDELNYYLARLGLIEADGYTQGQIVEEYQKRIGKGGFEQEDKE